MLKLQFVLLPIASTVVQVTLVTPLAKCVPEAGTHVIVGLRSQGSLAVAVNETTASHWPGSVFFVMSGQVITIPPPPPPLTVTVKLQPPALLAASVAEQL